MTANIAMESESRDLRDKLAPFRRRWLLMTVVVVVLSALTYHHYHGEPAKYVATSSLFVRSSAPDPVLGASPVADPVRRLQNEAGLLQSPRVAARVAAKLDYKGDPSGLLGLITVTPSPNSDFITIAASASDPKSSAAVANGFAAAFVEMSSDRTRADLAKAQTALEMQLAEVPNTRENKTLRRGLMERLKNVQVNLTTLPPVIERINRATPPASGVRPSAKRNAFFAAILGLVLATLLVLALESLDRRVRHPLVESEYGLPLLASIPFSRRAAAAPRSASRLPHVMMERVRGLRTTLDHGAGAGPPPRTILLTSAISGEGKSTLVKSLALAYFESARSVLVIDADLRRPTMHEFLDAALVPGLSDVLRGTIWLPDAVQEIHVTDIKPAFAPLVVDQHAQSTEGQAPQEGSSWLEPRSASGTGMGDPAVHLLAGGSATSDPAALLGSPQLKALLAEAAASYDVVLIDSPPMLTVSDAIPLAAAADAVIVVARAEFTTRDAVRRCRQALDRMPTLTVRGVVVNSVRGDDTITDSHYLAPAPSVP
jgi:polysaccharide biosynthesis transport protein